jgi:hypothetical protein
MCLACMGPFSFLVINSYVTVLIIYCMYSIIDPNKFVKIKIKKKKKIKSTYNKKQCRMPPYSFDLVNFIKITMPKRWMALDAGNLKH